MRLKIDLIAFGIILLALASVTAFQANSVSYNASNKFDFGAVSNNTSSASFNQRFISGFQAVASYFSSSYAGRFGILEDIANVPTISGISLNSSDDTDTTLQDLHCSANLIDSDGEAVNVTVVWYKNSVEYLATDYNNSYSSGSFFVADLDSANTTKGETWICGMKASNNDQSIWYNSSSLVILNSIPVLTLDYPADDATITNRTPTFNWTASDDDNDVLTYDFNISLVPASLCSEQDRYVQDIADEEYTLPSTLNCFYDNLDYYIWSVRVKDGEYTSPWATYRTLKVSAVLDLSLPTSSVLFGNLPFGGSNDTTSDSPAPLVVRNNGQVLVNVNISATDLWSTSPNPSAYFKLKVDNVSGEEGSFNWTASSTDWVNAPATNNSILISALNYVDSTDSAELDIYVEVPPTEVPAAKSSVINFFATLGE